MLSHILNSLGVKRYPMTVKLLVLAVLLSAALPNTLFAEVPNSGLPTPSAQFLRAPQEGLRFLQDLGPGYTLAQRISNRKLVIVECFEKSPARVFEVDAKTQKQSRSSLIGARCWWTGATNKKLPDPRVHLLIDIQDEGLHGITNALGQSIIKQQYASIAVDEKMNYAAFKQNALQTRGDLDVFDRSGRLLNSALNICPYDYPIFQTGFIEVGDHLVKLPQGGVTRGRSGLLDANGKQIYPRVLDGCIIGAGHAQCYRTESGKTTYLLIDNSGKVVAQSSDPQSVDIVFKKISQAWLDGPHQKLENTEFYIDVEKFELIANADRSLDSPHFSPILWRANSGKKGMFIGFLQDHKLIGMKRNELQLLLGDGTPHDINGELCYSYTLSDGFHCGLSGESISLRIKEDKVCAWAHNRGAQTTRWQTTEPDAAQIK